MSELFKRLRPADSTTHALVTAGLDPAIPRAPFGLIAIVMLALAGPAAAQGIDLSGGGPVEVTASDGIEWRQAEQVVIARGNARAVRGDVTVTADRLIARYRPAAGTEGAPRPAEPNPAGGGELWRLEAEGRVKIATATDQGQGDRAVYDIDQAVLVLSGRDLALKTPQQTITARDSLEYWSTRKMAVARGNALVVEPAENRRIGADTLVAYFRDAAPSTPTPPRVAPVSAPAPGAATAAPPGSGRLDRVEAFGNVEIRTPEEVVRGERGVYSATTGLARLLGGVRITRGDNQLNGREALVNMTTGVSRLVAAPGQRVQGLVVQQQPGANAAPTPTGPRAR